MIITLTTDYGLADGYVAAMKGAIYSLAPRLTVVDLSHHVPPFAVAHAAFVLRQAAPFFPPDTVHVAVVDPGVGGPRRGIAVARARQFFVGPDNGVFTPFLDRRAKVRELTNEDLWLPAAAATFHGRDLFAPTAARLATGLPFAACGPLVKDPVRLDAWRVRRRGGVFHAPVVHIDHFGNCLTALPAARLVELGGGPRVAELPDGARLPVRRTYAEAKPGEGLALTGSTGLLEIAVNEGSAAATFRLAVGSVIRFAGG